MDAATLAERVAAKTHRFNNALTTILGLVDWHLEVESHPELLRADLAKMRTAVALARDVSIELQRLVADTMRRSSPAPVPAANAGGTANAEDSAEARDERRSQGSVLVVDDHPDVRNSLCVMVRTLGYPAHAVDSGDAALAWLAGNTARLVFTDLGMPGMDGATVAKAIVDRQPGTPVVLMTGWGAMASPPPGVCRVIAKPIRMALLRECLETFAGSAAS
jgi:CheY-like chemotaxis protein